LLPSRSSHSSAWCAPAVWCVSSRLLFFLSSRRRHTRSKRDWSSDVCSSDLNHPRAQISKMKLTKELMMPCERQRCAGCSVGCSRSEERRVGKEGRSQWGREQRHRERGEGGAA